MSMFCYQCEQAAKGTGCTAIGVCGKQPDVAALQDLLVYTLKGIAFWADKARAQGKTDQEIDRFMIDGPFTPASIDEQVKLGELHGVKDFTVDPDIHSVREITMYGLKGYAAYADHARILGKESDEIYAFTHKALAAQLDDSLDLMANVGLAMEAGKINYLTMELLNQAHVEAYGHPVPTPVQLGTKHGKGILVSGHDLKMLEELLKQTEGKCIDVYTHVEMLPAHGYPGLKKYKHLAGNFGGAWQDQYKEFQDFPGAIIFNTNCIQKPAESYKDRLFTWGLVQWPGVKHVDGWDFSEVIRKAQECEGFEDNPGQEILTGFGHNAILGVADKVIEGVKAGAIRHFFLVGGCDGAKSGRNYYTEFAEQAPSDTVILTLACGKFRFNKLDLGDIGGIPRLLDVGQCNDAYSAIQVALALAEAFECGVNDLPLSLGLSWYEQTPRCSLVKHFTGHRSNRAAAFRAALFFWMSESSVEKDYFNHWIIQLMSLQDLWEGLACRCTFA